MTGLILLLGAIATWTAGYLVGGHRPRPEERFPIATAPRDGQMVKLWFGTDDEKPTVGWWAPKNHPGMPWMFLDSQTGLGTWFGNWVVSGPGGPTHWAPL